MLPYRPDRFLLTLVVREFAERLMVRVNPELEVDPPVDRGEDWPELLDACISKLVFYADDELLQKTEAEMNELLLESVQKLLHSVPAQRCLA